MEDAAAVEVVQSVLQLQVYLLSLWEKGFATAAEPDENDAREAEGLRYELQQQEYADETRLGPRASQHARSPAALTLPARPPATGTRSRRGRSST